MGLALVASCPHQTQSILMTHTLYTCDVAKIYLKAQNQYSWLLCDHSEQRKI